MILHHHLYLNQHIKIYPTKFPDLKMQSTILSLLIILFTEVTCEYIYSISDHRQTAYYKCFKNSGRDQVILYVQSTNTDIADSEVGNVMNAKNAELSLEVLYSPCRARAPEDQISLIVDRIGRNVVDRFWIYPCSYGGIGCSWNKYSPQSNCLYLQKFIEGLKIRYGSPVQIADNSQDWMSTFKSQNYCSEVSSSKLWWGPTEKEQDFRPDFSSYHKFGGWSTPYMKMLNQTFFCNQRVMTNYYV